MWVNDKLVEVRVQVLSRPENFRPFFCLNINNNSNDNNNNNNNNNNYYYYYY